MFWVVLRLAAGIFLTLLGIIGFLVPIMPNLLFLIPGLILLGTHFRWARRLLDYVRGRKASRNAR
ncbi:MAG: PGPGW domain-containing protein [Terriglobia bacterium]